MHAYLFLFFGNSHIQYYLCHRVKPSCLRLWCKHVNVTTRRSSYWNETFEELLQPICCLNNSRFGKFRDKLWPWEYYQQPWYYSLNQEERKMDRAHIGHNNCYIEHGILFGLRKSLQNCPQQWPNTEHNQSEIDPLCIAPMHIVSQMMTTWSHLSQALHS